MRLPDPTDHAFASGPVFARPSSLLQAYRWTGNWHSAGLLRAVWRQFTAGASVGEGVLLGLGARLINLSEPVRVVIGPGAVIRGILRVEPGGSLRIGSGAYLGDGSIVSASESVVIGDETLMAHGVQVFDNDTHPVEADERARHFRMIRGVEPPGPVRVGRAAVLIGDHCWLSMNTLVLKGSGIGERTVVAAGAVVTGPLPRDVVAGGNPARVLKQLAVATAAASNQQE